MMQVFLYCEGVTDFEPLCVLMRKASKAAEMSIIRKTRRDLRSEITVLANRRGIHKHMNDIDRLAMAAKKAKCKHIAYHQDADGGKTDVYVSIQDKFSAYKL